LRSEKVVDNEIENNEENEMTSGAMFRREGGGRKREKFPAS